MALLLEFLTFLRSSPPFLCRVLPASRLLLRARLFTCTASAAKASTAATTTRSSTASTFFYHEASGGKYVPRKTLFEPGMIGPVRASPLGELFRPGKLVK